LAFGWPICPKTGRNACPRPRIDAWRSADSRTASKSNLTMPTSSPLSGQLVTIFGGSGYIGNYVARACSNAAHGCDWPAAIRRRALH